MNAEKLLDAIQYLPDEMLEQTDRLRRKKPLRWQRWAALAACLCLVAGMAYSFMLSGAKSSDGATSDRFYGELTDEDSSMTGTTSWLAATVNTVAEDRLVVTMLDGKQAVVLLTNLEKLPDLVPGQKIRMYLNDIVFTDGNTLTPYKIEIEEELP